MAHVAASAERGLHALLASQDARGAWSDFPRVGNGSDEWVTGYVGAAVAAHAPAAAERAWRSLAARRRWSGGWGFMPSYPADADSTVCALRLAESLPNGGGLRAWRARAFVRRHQRFDGGIATYLWPRRMVWHTRLRESFEGWCAPHVCVSANAAQLHRFAGRRRVLDFLVAKQDRDGAWRAYWWYDEREYATALAVDALASSPDSRHRAAARRGVEWAAHAASAEPAVHTAAAPDGSPFATALRLHVLARGGAAVADLRARTAAWLVEAQAATGLWPASAWLRFPPTQTVDTSTIGEWHIGEMVRAGVMVDDRALFTTATVVTALHAAAAASRLDDC
ncbi:MAG TPA: prenyltransferase/squalene oxidase repeat-containing protein [Gemmatimonadaceae bacterium]|nr:prenyltransferase/squalene oxidase repeat-containing protein [Gemmatimonadaceae bacterium]